MKSSISFLLLVIFAVVLAAQQSHAKKGCNAYGHACYGGHGKRSLGTLMGAGIASVGKPGGGEQEPEAILQIFPDDVPVLHDGELDNYPRYRLIKIMKSVFNGHPKRPSERMGEIDYPISGENFNRDNGNSFN